MKANGRGLFTLLTGCLLVALPAVAALPADEESEDLGRVLLTAELVRVADVAGPLGAGFLPAPAGTDAIDEGMVQVRARRKVVIALDGAQPSSTHEVFYCAAAGGAWSCALLGALATDEHGRARESLDFTQPGTAFTGMFAVVRGNRTQFVSGFGLPAAPAPAGVSAAVNVKGQVASVNQQAGTFKLAGFAPTIAVDSETKFKGGVAFAGLLAGMTVEVDGTSRQDGSVLAAEVKVARHGR
ncbi:MAG: hypothetical protein HY858_17265 [Candidatus Solibacter usitatus]|nr:hypothetical protein [Candidatus Solibacter usitatus]